MFSIKQETHALDLTSGARRFLSSNSDHDETFSTEEEILDCIPKVIQTQREIRNFSREENISNFRKRHLIVASSIQQMKTMLQLQINKVG